MKIDVGGNRSIFVRGAYFRLNKFYWNDALEEVVDKAMDTNLAGAFATL